MEPPILHHKDFAWNFSSKHVELSILQRKVPHGTHYVEFQFAGHGSFNFSNLLLSYVFYLVLPPTARAAIKVLPQTFGVPNAVDTLKDYPPRPKHRTLCCGTYVPLNFRTVPRYTKKVFVPGTQKRFLVYHPNEGGWTFRPPGGFRKSS